MLFLGLVQVGLALYVRTTLVACAAEGARYGANADRGEADAAAHAAQLVRAALADSYAEDVRAGSTVVDGVRAVEVTITAPVPVIGLLGPARTLVVRGHAFDEDAV